MGSKIETAKGSSADPHQANQVLDALKAVCNEREKILNRGLSRTSLLRSMVDAARWGTGAVKVCDGNDPLFEPCTHGLRRAIGALGERLEDLTNPDEEQIRIHVLDCVQKLEALHAAALKHDRPAAEAAFRETVLAIGALARIVPDPAP